MKEIELTRGKIVMVDDEDYVWLDHYNWSAHGDGNTTYAARRVVVAAGKSMIQLMHRFITKAVDGVNIDHRNGNGLDNQRHNLRVGTKQQNGANMRKRANTASRFKGVYWHKQCSKWCAEITYLRQKHGLGLFTSEIKAAEAYDNAARQMFGDHAAVNFPREGEQSCHREPT